MSSLDTQSHVTYLLRLADDCLVHGHRLSEWCGHAPTLEEDLALANIALDLIGQARALYTHAGNLEGKGRDEDQLAYLRDAHEFTNTLLVEKKNGDFAYTITRLLFHAAYAEPLFAKLAGSSDAVLAGIAAKAVKETDYHVRHAAEWLIRLGDGTEESHKRAQYAVDDLWMYTGEMLKSDELDRTVAQSGVGVEADSLREAWQSTIRDVLSEATLTHPEDDWMIEGGRTGQHSEHLGHLLADMQFLQRAYPGNAW